MDKKFNIAIVGATGNVGRETLKILEERNFPCDRIHVIASVKSVGKELSFKDKTLKIEDIASFDFSNVGLAFFSAGSMVSKTYIPKAIAAGVKVIDKSSHFRLNDDIPLIVPEVNWNKTKNYSSDIISNPNCCTIPLVMALKPLDNAVKIKRIVASSYQSVSGAGKAGMDELFTQTKSKFMLGDVGPSIFPHTIAFNLFPHIGEFETSGNTEEEEKVARETTKILGDHAKTTITCVRVPVFRGHSFSVNVEFEDNLSAEEAYEILSETDGILVNSVENQHQYATPIDSVGEDCIFVSRIRNDSTQKNTLNLWIVADNLRKGAALNAVQIAEYLYGINF